MAKEGKGYPSLYGPAMSYGKLWKSTLKKTPVPFSFDVPVMVPWIGLSAWRVAEKVVLRGLSWVIRALVELVDWPKMERGRERRENSIGTSEIAIFIVTDD